MGGVKHRIGWCWFSSEASRGAGGGVRGSVCRFGACRCLLIDPGWWCWSYDKWDSDRGEGDGGENRWEPKRRKKEGPCMSGIVLVCVAQWPAQQR